jgi:hypothetical protein
LPLFAVGGEAKPGKIGADRLDIVLAAACRVGVVDAQQEPPAALPGQQPVMQRGADIADVEIARGAWGEAGVI